MRSRSNTLTASTPFANTRSSERSWLNVAVLVVCGAALACGFFFAARQHFTSMELGIKNSQLRKQLSEMEAENRRLSLAKEVALSPMAIRKASRIVSAPKVNQAVVAETASMSTMPSKALPPDTEVRAALTKADAVKVNIASKVEKVVLSRSAVKSAPAAKPVKATPDVKSRHKAL